MTPICSAEHLPFDFSARAYHDHDERTQSLVPLPAPWQQQIRAELRALPAAQAEAWCALWLHCNNTKGKEPTAAWLKKAQALAEPVLPQFTDTMVRWLELIVTAGQHYATPWWQNNQPLVRAFCWLASLGEAERLAMPVARLMNYCHFFRLDSDGKLRQAELVSAGGFWTLSGFGSAGILAALWLKRQGIWDFSYNLLEPFLADQLDLLAEELPYDEPFDAQGLWVTHFGSEATLTYRRNELYRPTFVDSKGKTITKEPRKLWKQYAVTRNLLNSRLQALRNQSSALLEAMERALLSQRRWTGTRWLALFDDPCRFGYDVARMRIWNVQEGEQTRQLRWMNNAWRNIDGDVVAAPTASSVLWLWHPALDPDEQLALRWRQTLMAQRISEGVQAWRVVFRPLPEEADQATSRRFANYRHLERFYYWHPLDHNDPRTPHSKALADGWTARLYHQLGWFSQLQFLQQGVPRPLAEVPPIIYSEGLAQAALTLQQKAEAPLPQRQLHIDVLWLVLQNSGFADRLRLQDGRLYVRGDHHHYSLSLLDSNDTWITVHREPSGQPLTGFEPGVWGDEDKLFGNIRRNVELQAMYWPLIHEWMDRIYLKVRLLVHEDTIPWEWVRKQLQLP